MKLQNSAFLKFGYWENIISVKSFKLKYRENQFSLITIEKVNNEDEETKYYTYFVLKLCVYI